MIVGVGTDLVLIARIESSVTRFGDRFVKKILSEREQSAYKHANFQVSFLAKRFAAKEAVSKALGTGMRQGVSFPSIEVSKDQAGKPMVQLTGGSLARAEALGIQHWHLSLSDEKEHAIAFVVAEA